MEGSVLKQAISFSPLSIAQKKKKKKSSCRTAQVLRLIVGSVDYTHLFDWINYCYFIIIFY